MTNKYIREELFQVLAPNANWKKLAFKILNYVDTKEILVKDQPSSTYHSPIKKLISI